MNSIPTIVLKPVIIKQILYDKDGFAIPDAGSIDKTITCLRPGHKNGQPQIYSEEKNGKLISHNYGHGGDGWCLLFGSINNSIKNLFDLEYFSKDEEITIIGLGCHGLMTALKLYHKGYTNIKLIGETFLNTPSHNAGGLIQFYGDYKLEIMNKIKDI